MGLPGPRDQIGHGDSGDANTKHLIFGLPGLIAHLLSVIRLEPDDVISTGTPTGVSLGRKPQRWLKPGEEIVVEIERIGTLRSRTVASKQPAG